MKRILIFSALFFSSLHVTYAQQNDEMKAEKESEAQIQKVSKILPREQVIKCWAISLQSAYTSKEVLRNSTGAKSEMALGAFNSAKGNLVAYMSVMKAQIGNSHQFDGQINAISKEVSSYPLDKFNAEDNNCSTDKNMLRILSFFWRRPELTDLLSGIK